MVTSNLGILRCAVKNKIKLLAVLLSLTVLFACGGGGGAATPPSATTGDAVADAGSDQDVNRIDMVLLDGSNSDDPDNASLTYTWTQVHGPDVTGGAGSLTGVSPSFTAPEQVSTLIFELRVNDGMDSPADTVQINVMEAVSLALFVDGDNGSDTSGDGSRDNPFATIRHALSQVSLPRRDIYVKTLANDASYDEVIGTLEIYSGTSLYGGYDGNWVRDVAANKTLIAGHGQAVMIYFGEMDIWLSGFDISARDSLLANTSVEVIRIDNFPLEPATARLVIRDNTLIAGNVGAGTAGTPGNSFGIHSLYHPDLEISNNTIVTGRGGDGTDGDNGTDGVHGGDGLDGQGRSAGVGGFTPVDGLLSGGRGGTGDYRTFVDLPTLPPLCGSLPATAGEGEAGGEAGVGGDGGNGADATVAGLDANIAGAGDGDYSTGNLLPAHGQRGGDGQPGTPGSGGGGAAASAGLGGDAGSGGGASVAIYVRTTTNNQLTITGNSLQSGDGGNAGRGWR